MIEAKIFLNWWSILFLIMSSWEHPLIRMESIAFILQPFHQFLFWCPFSNYDNVPFRIAKHEKWFSSQFRTSSNARLSKFRPHYCLCDQRFSGKSIIYNKRHGALIKLRKLLTPMSKLTFRVNAMCIRTIYF